MEFYEILEVETTASQDEIKRSYRKLAMKYHPDRNGGDKEAEVKFKQINEAYETLGNEQKRQHYDRFGSSKGATGNPFGGAGVDVDLGDIFSSFFGGGFGGNQARTRRQEFKGEDIEETISIDLKTSILGGKHTVSYHKKVACSSCKGEGGTGKKTCSTCNGSGQVTKTSQSMFGMISQTVPCSDCGGTGETFETVCGECNGQKRVVKKVDLEIDIPAGIDHGMSIRINEEGNDGVGTKAKGDLYLHFNVSQEEKGLKRDGVDLHYELEIEIVEAVLGNKKEIQIPILGKRSIEIPAGTAHGNILKLPHDGVKHVNQDKKGDLFIHIAIKIPKKLGKQERSLYEEIAKEKKIEIKNSSMFGKLFA